MAHRYCILLRDDTIHTERGEPGPKTWATRADAEDWLGRRRNAMPPTFKWSRVVWCTVDDADGTVTVASSLLNANRSGEPGSTEPNPPRRRYVVQPCDNGTSLGERPRQRSWIVWDTKTETCESDHDTRAAARTEASRMNADPLYDEGASR